MGNYYEVIKYDEGLPLKAFVHSVVDLEMHWHNEVELLFILKGSVNIRLGSEIHTLYENDIILINKNQIHNTQKTKEDNIILALQINLDFFSMLYPRANNIMFSSNFLNEKEGYEKNLNVIRTFIAEIVWEINKKSNGYQLIIGSKLNLLASFLINNYEYTVIEEDGLEAADEDIKRLHNILTYIDDNLDKKITLQDIAYAEHINSYYLSHFFKNKVGINFQEYLNIKRLDKAFKLLLNSNMTITDISNKSGFSSTNYFNKVFKEAYSSLPSENRGAIGQSNYKNQNGNEPTSKTYLDVDRNAVFEKLFTYLSKATIIEAPINEISTKESIWVELENLETKPLNNHWQKLTSFGRAAEGLRAPWQKQLREMQEEIGFGYIRFHGIFSDDMMILDIDIHGNIMYNWTYVDQLFDFFKEVHIKPFIELGFMPTEFKSSEDTVFWWKGNISQPKDIGLWTDLVKEFIKHCIYRYGKREVQSWYFEVWNEPDLEGSFWIGGKEAYFNFYKETALAVHSISKDLKVGGPSITYQLQDPNKWLVSFLKYCKDGNLPLDFISIHLYPESFLTRKESVNFTVRFKAGEDFDTLFYEWTHRKRIYLEKDNLENVLSLVNEEISHEYVDTELHITEWNASAYNKNLIHDTAFVAAYIVDSVLKSIGKTNSLAYWVFTDLYEEFKVDKKEFSGNFGMISKSGLKKSSYYAYYLLSKLGNEIVDQGEEYIITRNDENIQILACNCTYFDDLFMNGDTSALSHTKRYDIYKSKLPKEIDITINGLNGKYKTTRYSLNKESGSVFDQWIKTGEPENMSKEEIDYLQAISKPKMIVDIQDIKEEYKEKINIPVHGVELIILQRID